MAELKRRMGAAEFRRWLQFHRESPIGDDRCHDLPGAMVRQTLAAIHRDPKTPAPSLDDFLPDWTQQEIDMDTQLLKMAYAQRGAAHGG